MLEPGTLAEMVRGKERIEVVVLHPRFKENGGKVWFEQDNSYGWGTAEPAELKPVRKAKAEAGENCKGCLYYDPGCIRHRPERWERFPVSSTRSARGKEIPFRLYPHCRERSNRIKIP